MKDMDTRSDSSAKSPFPSRAQMTRARLAAEAERAIVQDTQSTPQHTSENAERLASGTAAGVNSEGIAGLNSESAAGLNNESTAPLGGAGAAPRTSGGAALGGRNAVSATSWDAVLLGDEIGRAHV